MRENRGITLIALVVTIVVLLILAGVSISMLTGENGIITQAQESKIETRGGAVEEARDLWKTNQKADSFTDTSTAQTLDEVLTDLVDKDLLTEEERDEVEETGKVTIGSREIVFFEEMEDYDEYILEQIDENKIKIEILFLEKINEIISEELNSKTDEELFMLSINSNMTFQEFMKNIYEQGNIDTIYTSLKDWYLSMGMPEKEYEQNINFMKEDLQNDILENDIKIINPDGTIYSNSYIIPFETGEYIFSIQFLNQIYKIKVTIDEFEIMREGYNHIYLYNIINKKPVNILGGTVLFAGDNSNYEIENYLKKETQDYNYIDGNLLPGGNTIYKSNLSCNEINVKGYFETIPG